MLCITITIAYISIRFNGAVFGVPYTVVFGTAFHDSCTDNPAPAPMKKGRLRGLFIVCANGGLA